MIQRCITALAKSICFFLIEEERERALKNYRSNRITFVRCTSINQEFNWPRSIFTFSFNSVSIAFILKPTASHYHRWVSSTLLLLSGHRYQITFRLLQGLQILQHAFHTFLSFTMTHVGVQASTHRYTQS